MKLRLLFVTMALISCSIVAFCQQDRGNITGVVTDSTGAVLPGTGVVLKNNAGLNLSTVTNDSGQYHFDLLNPGLYTVRADKAGFKTATRRDLQIDVNAHVVVDFALQVGDKTETVEVQGAIEQLETSTGSAGMVIEEKQIQDLPLIYSNPYVLEFLAPGLLPSSENTNIHVYDSGSADVSINGSALRSIEYTLDGAPNNRIRLSAFTPSTEFISQYKIATSQYDATQGHSAGGFVNTSLKSGTDAFHGAIFASYQNPALNANYSNLTGAKTTAAKPTWLREGFTVGGPIKKDKLFFFTGLEHSRQANPNYKALTVPTMAERNGDFSALLAAAPTGKAYDTCLADSNGVGSHLNNPNPYQIFDPLSGRLSDPTKSNSPVWRKCYPGNIIPQSEISPIARKVLNYYPAPNAQGNTDGSNNFIYAGAEPDYYYGFATRIDYNIDESQKLFGHIVLSRRSSKKNMYFLPVSGTRTTFLNRGIVLGYTKIMSAATVVDVRASWTRFFNENVVASQGIVDPVQLGMPSYLLDTFANTADKKNAYRMPRFDLSGGYESLQNDTATMGSNDISMANVSASHLKGNHMFRFGGEVRMLNSNGFNSQNPAGNYSSNGNYATSGSDVTTSNLGFSVAQFLVGLTNSGNVVMNSDYAVRSYYVGGYLHDDWRVARNLTLNIGLRYEFESPNDERNGKTIDRFDFNAKSPISDAVAAAYAASTAGQSSLLPATYQVSGGLHYPSAKSSLWNPQKAIVMPRIGFAWAITPKTVLRGGVGLFYDSLSTYWQSGGNTGSATTLPQYGFSQQTNISGTPDNGLTFTGKLSDPFPTGLQKPSGSANGLLSNIGSDTWFINPAPKVPYNERWSIGVQRQIGGWVTSVNYVGARGVHLPVTRDYNTVPQQYLSKVANGFDLTTFTLLYNTKVNNPYKGTLQSYAPGANINKSSTVSVSTLLQPYPVFGRIYTYTTDGYSLYNSLQAQSTKRMTRDLSTTLAFTWSKSMDATQFLNRGDAEPWYGISQQDRPLRFSASAMYQLPFGKKKAFLSDGNGILAKVVGNWQVQGMYQIQSGRPIDFSASNYLFTGTDVSDIAWGRSGFRQDIKAGGKTVAAGHWFDTSEFATTTTTPKCPAGTNCTDQNNPYIVTNVIPNKDYQLRTFPYRFGNIRADHMNQFDMGLQRKFTLREGVEMQIRGEAINVLNHAVYSGPTSMDPTNKSFGQVTTQANSPRVIQWAGFIRF